MLHVPDSDLIVSYCTGLQLAVFNNLTGLDRGVDCKDMIIIPIVGFF